MQLLLKGCSEQGFKKIRVHVLTDGRDVADGSSVKFVQELEDELAEMRNGGCDACIASGGGRMKVTMDRYEVHIIQERLSTHRYLTSPTLFFVVLVILEYREVQ